MKIDYLWQAFSYLSVISSLILMDLVWIQRRTFSTSPTQLIFYMSLSDLMYSSSQAIGWSRRAWLDVSTKDSDIYCGMSFIIFQVGGHSSVFWHFIISLNVFLILRGWTDARLRSLRPFQHFVVWGYAIGATLPPFLGRKYGSMPSDLADYCYYPDPLDPLRLLFTVPISIALFSSLFIFLYLVYFLLVRPGTFKVAILRRMTFVVFGFLILWGPGFFSRISDVTFHTDSSSVRYFYFYNMSDNLSGFVNLMVWGMTNPKIIDWIKSKIYDEPGSHLANTTDAALLVSDDYTINSSLTGGTVLSNAMQQDTESEPFTGELWTVVTIGGNSMKETSELAT